MPTTPERPLERPAGETNDSAFLLTLVDAIRPHREAADIIATASGMLGKHLGASRVAYGTIEDEIVTVGPDYTDGVPSMAGTYQLATLVGSLLDLYREDGTFAVDDVSRDERLGELQRKNLAAAQIGAVIGVVVTREGRWVAGFSLQSRTARTWTPSEITLTAEVAERVWGAIERVRIDVALREREERLKIALAAGRLGMWRFDLRTNEQTWSPRQYEIFGLDPAEPAPNLEAFLALVHPEDRPLVTFGPTDLWQGSGILDSEFRITRPDGEHRWLTSHSLVRHDANGEAFEVVGVNFDATERKKAEQHQQFLLAELQHRVRNTLAVIRSIARRTGATSESAEDYALHLEGRLDAFARVQAATTRDPRAGADLASLVAEEMLAAAAREGEHLSISGPEVKLRGKGAETFALALHELATNAVKYGALAAEAGRIDIDWIVDEGTLRFRWLESGLDVALAPPSRRGFGMEILERTLAYELKAKAVLDFRPSGLACVLEIPLDRVALDRR